MEFRETLVERQKEVNSLLCVGLDPLVKKMPMVIRESYTYDWNATLAWMTGIVNATAKFACMFKPNRAYWERIDGGEKALRALIRHIHIRHPSIPVFLDCKRGDIDSTQEQYREAHFTLDGVDGMNYNGYMGSGTLKALIDPKYMGRGLVGLGRTSNSEAWEIQDEHLESGGSFWEWMVGRILKWSDKFGVLENAGVVMGAAYNNPMLPSRIESWHLVRARQIVGEKLWFLIPGIGTQGGCIESTVTASFKGPGSIAINSSSAINFASNGPDYAEAAARVAEETRDKIRAASGNCS